MMTIIFRLWYRFTFFLAEKEFMIFYPIKGLCWQQLDDETTAVITSCYRLVELEFLLSSLRSVSHIYLQDSFNRLFATHRWVKYPVRLCSPAFVGNHPGRIKTMHDWCLILHRKFNYTKDGYYPLGHYPEVHYWNRFGVYQVKFVLLYVNFFCLCFVLFKMKHC